MGILKALKYLNQNSIESKEAKKITDKLPSNDNIAKDILKNIGNKTTKIVLDNDIKNSYYVYLKDTIYISNKEKNNGIHRCCLVAHECEHSIQSKLLQKINFIVSNIELIMFVISLILSFIFKNNIITYIYFGISLLSVLPRLYLELDAIKKSVKLSNEYIKDILNEEDTIFLTNIYETQTKLLLPIALFSLFFGKIIRVVIIFIINYFL